jgi:hypothetical protein
MKDCQAITELLERSKFERLSWSNRLAIRFHGGLCRQCRHYFRDSEIMDALLSSKRFKHLSEYTFSPAEKDSLKKRIKESQTG